MKALMMVVGILGLMSLSSCERAVQNMYDQPRDKPYSANPLFKDGKSSRPAPLGSEPYARGAQADSSSAQQGTAQVEADQVAEAAQNIAYPMTMQVLEHGRERFNIYCMPCHSPIGDGDGRIVRRGFPAPPSYHIDRLRQAPDRHFYDVISNGYGVMARYGDRIEPSDRWAIVAYIRALQLSQHAQVNQLSTSIQDEVKQGLAAQPNAEINIKAQP